MLSSPLFGDAEFADDGLSSSEMVIRSFISRMPATELYRFAGKNP
jgi:hypothetical protein